MKNNDHFPCINHRDIARRQMVSEKSEEAIQTWLEIPANEQEQPWASSGLTTGQAGFTLRFFCENFWNLKSPSPAAMHEAALILKDVGVVKKRIIYAGSAIILWASENIENRLMSDEFTDWLNQPINFEQQPWASQEKNLGSAGVTTNQVAIDFLKKRNISRSILKIIAARLGSLGFYRHQIIIGHEKYSVWRTKTGDMLVDAIQLMEWLDEVSQASWRLDGQSNREAGITIEMIGQHFLHHPSLTNGESRRIGYQLRRYGFVCRKIWADKQRRIVWFYRRAN